MCTTDKEICQEYTYFYYNWLVCDCLPVYISENSCESGFKKKPSEYYECISDEDYSALFPSWATDEDITQYETEGIRKQKTLLSGDPACPIAKRSPCSDGFYWNRLACECLVEVQCEKGCAPGTALDPSKSCGDCMPQTEIYSQFYPEWANPYDVEKARKAGLNPIDKTNKKW